MENLNNNLKETYNKIAKDWNKDHGGDDWWVAGTDDFLALLPKDANILDVGCGGGYKTKYMKDKGFDVEGVDFSEGMIEEAKQKFSDVNFEVFDVYNFDKFPRTFDGIFCQAVLLHIPKDKIIEVLEKLKSKLNKNGLLYVAVKDKPESGIEEEIRKENDYGYEYERFFSYFSLEEMKQYFEKIGLKVIYDKDNPPSRSVRKTKWINIIGKKLD